jgi:very-short-patch-repair endonuclease
MSIHLRAHHQVKFLDYVEQNLSDFAHLDWIRCGVCGKVTKSYAKKGGACSRECSAKIRETWTGESASHYGCVMSEEAKKKIGEANSHNKPFLGKHHTKESREKMSKTRLELGLGIGEKNGMFGKTHTPEAIKKIMSHRPMNKLEEVVAKELDNLNIKYTFQFFINDSGVCKSYDFKLKRRNIIIEVDGDFWHGNPDTKYHHDNIEETKENDALKEKMATDRGYKVIRLWERDIKRDSSIIGTKLKELI